jgi:uncharacterized cupin superfamily protein
MKSPIEAVAIETQRGQSIYPEPFSQQVSGRVKWKLGEVFGLSNFGVNITHIDPGSISALFHTHAVQDEFIYILEGTPTLIFGDKEFQMKSGECMGFKAGTGIGHQLVNRSSKTVAYIEVGDRTPNERVEYPHDDIEATSTPDGPWVFTHKNGASY